MMPLQGGLSVERMCELAPVSRAGFYRWLQEPESVEEEIEVRSVIQQIAIEHRRRYGYRRISAELRRHGIAVNHKRVARIMREDNLLAVQPRQFHPLRPEHYRQACRSRCTTSPESWLGQAPVHGNAGEAISRQIHDQHALRSKA
jgi:hypothetical protein